MIEMMRPVIDFLNELDKDIDEHTRESSPLMEYLKSTPAQSASVFTSKSDFRAPTRESAARKAPRTVKIQYSKPVKDVEFLKDALSLTSARAVGEKTFDFVLKRQRAK